MRRFFVVLFAFVVLVALPQVTFAHATPIEYIPAALSRLEQAPAEIRIRFSERPERGASAIDVYGPDGAKLPPAPVTMLPGDPRGIRMPFSADAKGTYAVSWSVISADDGHFTKGAFAFSIGEPTVPLTQNTFDIDHTASLPEGISIALEMLGQALMLGALLLSLMPFGKNTAICRRWGGIFLVGALLSVVGALSYVVLQSAALGRGSFVDDARIFLGTTAGLFAAIRAGVSVLAVGAMFLPFLRLRMTLVVGALLMFVFLRARVSHAAAGEWPVFSVCIMAMHVLGKNMWMGVIVAFVATLPNIRKQGMDFFANASAEVSKLIAGGLALGGATGAYVVWLHLKRFDNIVATHWGMYALVLTGFAFLLLFLRFYNQCVTLAACKKVLQGKSDVEARATVGVSWAPLVVEAVVALGILAFSGMLVITTPPLRSSLYSHTVISQGVAVTLTEHRYEDDVFLLTFDDPTMPEGFETPELTIFARHEDLGIGPLVMTPETRFRGGYALKASLLTPPGRWHLEVSAVRQNGYDAVGGFHVRIPDDMRGVQSHVRNFDAFAVTMIVIGLACIALALGLFLHARRSRSMHHHDRTVPFSPTIVVVVLVTITSVALMILFGWMLLHHSHGGFGKLCLKNSHAWRESLPMHAGFPTSSVAALGCTVETPKGRYHFGDPREYLYFLENDRIGA